MTDTTKPNACRELKPCPFCGAGETRIVPGGRVWTGMKYGEPASVSVRHWCTPVEGQPSRMIERVGRDETSAIAAWSARAPVAQQSEDKRDTERLDWLDKMNSVLNQHYGTVYRWKVILSPNIVRLMVGVQQRGFVGDLDLNDAQSGANSFTSCREAIDAVRASTGDKA